MGKHKTDSINYRKPWSPEEDLRLSQLVVIEGTQRWSKIALEMPSRNGKQCRERWLNQAQPAVSVSVGRELQPGILLTLILPPSLADAEDSVDRGGGPCSAQRAAAPRQQAFLDTSQHTIV